MGIFRRKYSPDEIRQKILDAMDRPMTASRIVKILEKQHLHEKTTLYYIYEMVRDGKIEMVRVGKKRVCIKSS